ncbi:hypothetical protein RJ640_014497 [Escallonia rubra]|uniref:Uncharacterized protein n=1 Tax=Escallonia rubra TaxID=112253 RepID=A0AA88UPB6_9ASTE|nr:hypothetical protein RJ640_014497 [Escallonia rubra]
MIEVNASYNLDFCVVGEWRAIYTGIVAYRGTNPIGSEVVWIGVDHVFPCLEGKLLNRKVEQERKKRRKLNMARPFIFVHSAPNWAKHTENCKSEVEPTDCTHALKCAPGRRISTRYDKMVL